MPSELTNQIGRSTGATGAGTHIGEEKPIQLIVVTFTDATQAEALYQDLVELDDKKVVNLEDAIFVTKDAEGTFKVDERVHNEKRSGAVKGAVFGTLIGWMLGGPVLGLAGGTIVGRMIGKRVDLGIDKSTVQSIGNELEPGHTALFILGTATHAPTVVETFKRYNGRIVQTTIEPDAQARLQKALDAENAD
jgi:uncharacterized membrane protein